MERTALKSIAFQLLAIVLSFSLVTPAFAQQPAAPATQGKSSKAGPRRQLATIIFAGLGGAILGLSTLSFYGRPQDHLSNIAIGFAFGVISGTAYVTYNAATRPQEFYGQAYPQFEREAKFAQLRVAPSAGPRTLGLGFTF